MLQSDLKHFCMWTFCTQSRSDFILNRDETLLDLSKDLRKTLRHEHADPDFDQELKNHKTLNSTAVVSTTVNG